MKVLQAGDAGAALNQVILTKSNPIGDVFFGVDNTFLSRALRAGVFAEYRSPALSTVPAAYQLDPTHHLTPVDHGDVCINYDKQWFAKQKLPVPNTLADLTKPAYKGRLVVENPATSSPGLAFQLATIARFGTNGWRDYWAKLRANDVKVDDGWESAYDGDFTAGREPRHLPSGRLVRVEPARGRVLLEAAAHDVARRHHARLVLPPGRVRRRAARAPRTRPRRASWSTSCCRRTLPGRHPAPDVRVPGTRRHARSPRCSRSSPRSRREPLTLPAAEIGAHRDAWIEQWTETVLR